MKQNYFGTELGFDSPALSLFLLQVPSMSEVPLEGNVGSSAGTGEPLLGTAAAGQSLSHKKIKPAASPLASEQHFISLEITSQRRKEIPRWGCQQHSSPLLRYHLSITFARKRQQIMSVSWKKNPITWIPRQTPYLYGPYSSIHLFLSDSQLPCPTVWDEAQPGSNLSSLLPQAKVVGLRLRREMNQAAHSAIPVWIK